MSFKTPAQQWELIRKGAAEIIPEEELLEKLERSYKENRPLTVKAGFDPTAPDIHLGHTVLLRKLRHFQILGHRVVFLIGDFTALIGDPTGRNKTRAPLTKEQILKNTETYKSQVFKILDPEKTVVEFNSKWLGQMNLEDMIRLTSKYTVARILERDDYLKRYKAGIPIGLHEFLYPLLQAYDSVALKADVELGGTDQKFNLLVGREIQKEFDLRPQTILTMPILEGLDGVHKMSKSLGNYIGIQDSPSEMVGKVMSISDDLMWRYYELLTDLTPTAIEEMKEAASSGKSNPRDLKLRLGGMIVSDFWGEGKGKEAVEEFLRVFSKKELPDELPEVHSPDRTPTLLQVLNTALPDLSNAELKRLAKSGAITLDGEKASDLQALLSLDQPRILKVGKKSFFRIL
ncbi:MAG TPA: tyrosine--tRNA ligase [Candidatus Aminicenantes bacterium]|nr:tyrosine--tRNA ligase [Candidatus Aminicenantes bacterium]HPT00871.1 tyrosine--tRNA ligase [Candidatus Aminicenantes bacterium]